MQQDPSRMFRTAAAQPRIGARMTAAVTAHAADFAGPAAARNFFALIVTAPDLSWTFRSNGKAATTAALEVLFHLTFGHPLSASLTDPQDLNDRPLPHRLSGLGIFPLLHQRPDVADLRAALSDSLKITVVRDPGARAVSAFRYLCRSERLGHPQFMRDRALLCALTGFDWARDPGTPDGFARFLDYVAMALEHHGTRPVDLHWRPQWMTIRPDLYPPDIVGRAEAFDAFAATLAARLDRPPPPADSRANAQGAPPDPLAAALERAEIRRRLHAVYGGDYAAFGYPG